MMTLTKKEEPLSVGPPCKVPARKKLRMTLARPEFAGIA